MQSLPLDLDLVMYAGTTFNREFRWLPDGVNPQDFTGWDVTMLLGTLKGVAVKTLTTDPDGGLTLGPDGMITMYISADETPDLVGVENLFYVLDTTDPDGDVTRFLRGRVQVIVDVEPAPVTP